MNADDVTITVTSDRYCAMLENFLQPKLDDLFYKYGAENVWFQQDGATAHTSRRSLGILREMFRGYVVSLHGDFGWPPRSPDLIPCDFFLWDYLKFQVYQHRPQTLEGQGGDNPGGCCHSARNDSVSVSTMKTAT
jgi:hypothetical protein